MTLNWVKTVAEADNCDTEMKTGKTLKYLEKPAALPNSPLWSSLKLMLCCMFDPEVKGRKNLVSVV